MNSSCFISPRLFFATARPATYGAGVNETFGDLIPPLLLASRPYFFLAAIGTAKRNIDVVAPCDESGSAVAIVRREQFLVDGNHSVWRIPQLHRLGNRAALERAFFSLCADFHAPLFAAFHEKSLDDAPGRHSTLQFAQSTATVLVSPLRRYEYWVLPGPILKIAWRRSSSLVIFLPPIARNTSPT